MEECAFSWGEAQYAALEQLASDEEEYLSIRAKARSTGEISNIGVEHRINVCINGAVNCKSKSNSKLTGNATWINANHHYLLQGLMATSCHLARLDLE